MEQVNAIHESAASRNIVKIDRDDIEAAWRRATGDNSSQIMKSRSRSLDVTQWPA
jgi:hypothetical protein